MSKSFKKIVAIAMAMILCMGVLGITAMAEGYDLMSVYEVGGDGYAYEMSGHMLSTDGGVHNDIPQTLVMVPAEYYSDNWSVSGEYEALYCCDAETGYEGGIPYRRVNLEDSDYYSDSNAKRIRTIVMNSYPFISMNSMKSMLREDGFEGADELTRSEAISAVQAAIWYCANGERYSYSRTFNVPDNPQWGEAHRNIVDEGEMWWEEGKRVFSTSEEVGSRINSLRDYLLDLSGKSPKSNQVIISELKILESMPIEVNNGTFRVALRVKLNNSGSSASDDISVKIFVNGEIVKEVDVVYGKDTTFDITVEAKSGQVIKAVVSGTQILPKGAYFYEPEGGRDTSQCLVGVYKGETAVHAEASVTLKAGEFSFPKGGASNISYMLIKDGKVKFVKKVDLDDGDTNAPIIMKDGYISAMFIKQSTSGMFWISESVDEETVQAVIDCLIANNPSYRGHDENIAFGFGEHTLTYTQKNGKAHTVDYTFSK